MRKTDPNGNPIDVPGSVVFKDATATPKLSPVTPVSGQVVLKPPANALYCVFRTSDDGSVSDTANGANGYYPVTSNQDFRYPCTNGQSIYIDSNNPVFFMFEVL